MSLIMYVKTEPGITYVGAERSLTTHDFNYPIRIYDKGTKINKREEGDGIIAACGPAVMVDSFIDTFMDYTGDLNELAADKRKIKEWFEEETEEIHSKFSKGDNDEEVNHGYHVFVITKDHAVLIDSFGFVAQLDERYYAIGAGADMALACMRYQYGDEPIKDEKDKICANIMNANDVVAHYCSFVGQSKRGYDIMTVGDGSTSVASKKTQKKGKKNG